MIDVGIWLTKYVTVPILIIALGIGVIVYMNKRK